MPIAVSSGSSSFAAPCGLRSRVSHRTWLWVAKALAGRPADRAIRDEMLIADLRTVHQAELLRLGVKETRCQAAAAGRSAANRPAVDAGRRAAQRGKPVFTTIADAAAATPAHLVDRRFTRRTRGRASPTPV